MNVMNSICARITPAPSSRAGAQPMDVGPRAREAAGRAARECARDVHANNAMPPRKPEERTPGWPCERRQKASELPG
jgi:hypothetical protein